MRLYSMDILYYNILTYNVCVFIKNILGAIFRTVGPFFIELQNPFIL